MQEAIDLALQQSHAAFQIYRTLPLSARHTFMHTIATEIEALGDHLLATASAETHLPEARLRAERTRTLFQLRSYADALLQGHVLDIRIDTPDPNRNPPRPGLRKLNIPLGPVVVFGASNFPFAYSTAGGDTACALAAGCTVVVKAHPAHPKTSDLVATAIQKAAAKTHMPTGTFIHIHGASHEAGAALVQHPLTKAVGFTGSFQGGKALFDLANARPEPIPVFAEMGSVNPVFLLPDKLAADPQGTAQMYAASITLSMGQFCTNPGILVGLQSPALDQFAQTLATRIDQFQPSPMLHPGIAKAYRTHRDTALEQPQVQQLTTTDHTPDSEAPTLASVPAAAFLANPRLHQEVFGPYAILVRCTTPKELIQVAKALRGQLTSTLIATPQDLIDHSELQHTLQDGCGRLILNGVPTGVEVVLAQHHGGPFPATTDSRFTAVGADGIRRFLRPITYQNWPQDLLPQELQDANPLNLWRTVNNHLTQDPIN